MKIAGADHTNWRVRDLDASLRFYRDGLGLTLRPESVDGTVAFFDMGGVWLALWGRDELAADGRRLL